MSAAQALYRSRSFLYALVGLVALAILLIGYVVGRRARESARQIIPGAGAIAAAPAAEAVDFYPKAVGGMAGGMGMRGGGGGGRAAMGRAAGGFETEGGEEFAARAGPSQPTPWPKNPMLIRTASLKVRVSDVAKAHAEVLRIAREANGYVADTRLSAETGPAYATITIRVPNAGLESVIDRVAALGKLLEKQIGAQEVTEEYVDLTSRRRNLEREEQRLLDLLQRAGRMRDLLEVEGTLARVRGEIEQISGRMRYLENRVALSTVQVRLEGPQPVPTAGGPVWTASDVSRQAMRSLLDTGRGLATMAIWMGIYSPVWLPVLAFFIWLIRRAAAPRAGSTAAGP